MTIRQHQNRAAVKHAVRSNPDLTVVGSKENYIFFATKTGESVEVYVNVDMTARQLLDAALDYQK